MLTLTALVANNPMAVMTAYGALRLLPGARLRWPGAHPELDYPGDAVADLAALVPGRKEAAEYRRYDDPRSIKNYAEAKDELPHAWLAAFAEQKPAGKDKDPAVQETGLLLYAGEPAFIAKSAKVLATLSKSKAGVNAKIEEALFGPWRYEDQEPRGMLKGWGWDPAQVNDAAVVEKKSSDVKTPGVAAAYWLGWESLPFWPVIEGVTIGMTEDAWRYPICAEWLDAGMLQDLILGGETPGVRWYRAEKVRLGWGHFFAWGQPELATSDRLG
jgi:hypothetical protein